MKQILISIGAKKKQLLFSNKEEAFNYNKLVKKPVFILSEYDEELYKDEDDIKYLNYQLVSNINTPSTVCLDRKNNSLLQCVNSSLKRIQDGLLIIDLPTKKDDVLEIYNTIRENDNSNVQIVLNLQNVTHLDTLIQDVHTGWRLYDSISKKEFDFLKEKLTYLDSVGLLITGALRYEYLKKYKEWCKLEEKTPDPLINNLAFYYSFSTINIKEEIFDELIEKTLSNLSYFNIEYSATDIKEMYIKSE